MKTYCSECFDILEAYEYDDKVEPDKQMCVSCQRSLKH